MLLNTNGTNNDGIGVVGGIDPSGGNFNMFSLTQADAQTLLVSSTTVTGGDTQTGTGLVRVLDIGAPGNLGQLSTLPIPGAVHLIGLAIQGNRALAVASSGGWQDFFTDQNAGLSGNVVLAILDTSDPRNPQPIATRALSRASRGVTLPVSFGNDKYAFASLGASSDTPQLFLVDSTRLPKGEAPRSKLAHLAPHGKGKTGHAVGRAQCESCGPARAVMPEDVEAVGDNRTPAARARDVVRLRAVEGRGVARRGGSG